MIHKNTFKLCLGILLSFMMLLPTLAQNTKSFKGVVVDETGEPIIGAAVKVVDTTIGTITDLNGKFVINVPAGKLVEISYIGYISQRISDFKLTKVVLKEDTQQLDEVVVVGYGTQKKAHLTGAIATVPMDDIQDISSGSLANTLSGLVNGVSVSGGNSRPGENARITIRQNDVLASMGNNNLEPLYVIDGYIYPTEVKVGSSIENLGATAFNNLDPSMIEGISVLKDAAAAVYGARAANGVILVTTKKGKLGTPQISYSGTFGIADEVSRPKMLNAYEYGRLWNAVRAADPTDTSINLLEDLFQADELNAMKGLNYDLLDKYWKSALTQQHSVNLSGATEKANYFAGISYFNQDGNLGNLDYDRWTYRAGVNVKVSKWLNAGVQVSGDYGKKNTPLNKVGGSKTEDYNTLLTHPYYIPEEINGLPIAAFGISNSQVSNVQKYNFSAIQNNGDYSRNMTSNMNINANLEYDFGWSKWLKGLKVRFTYSKSINSAKINQYGSSYDLYYMADRAGSGKHLYTPIPGQEDAYDFLLTADNFLYANNGKPVVNGDTSFLSRNMNRTDNYQMNFTVTYNRTFGDHTLGGLFSIERSEAESEYVEGSITYPYEFTNGQSNTMSAEGKGNTSFSRSESGTLSYIGRINYAYADKYLLEFLLRSDASTKFAPENYWGFFPSVSAGWVISQEDWFKNNVKGIDYLKLRASFGLTGRDNTLPWQWAQNYAMDKDKGFIFGTGTDLNAGSHITINKNISAVNRNAHWDKSYKANFGLDFNVLNNRLVFAIDGYYDWNREMLLPYKPSIPGTVGTQSAYVNYGEMDAYGVELSVTWRDKIGKDFKYKVQVNTGYTDNKVLVTDWDSPMTFKSLHKGERSDIGTWGLQCIGMFRSYQDIDEYFAKYNITKYMDMTKDQVRPGMLIYKDVRGELQPDGTYAGPDGVVDKENDQVRMANRSNPYGFTTNLSAEYKGFSISAQLNASWGGYSFVPTNAIKLGNKGDAAGGYRDLEYANMPSFWNVDNMYVYQDVLDAAGNVVVKANHDAKYPNLQYASVNSAESTFWRVSGTRIRLNRLTLAYKIPSKYTKMIGIESCRFNVTGQNLLSFNNPYPDNFMDPMISYGTYPTLRKFTIGVNVTF